MSCIRGQQCYNDYYYRYTRKLNFKSNDAKIELSKYRARDTTRMNF